ncbi:MAG: fatty acid desaturase [Bacteroidota bacterium]
MMQLDYLEYSLGGKLVRIDQSQRSWKAFWQTFFRNLSGPIIANLVLLGILTIVASPWLYCLWLAAYLTTFQFVLRIRSMAEHSVVEDSTDPLRNTRTTYANWIERMLFAPYHVNYHVEHHMLMAVPSYRLPYMHRLLKERGFYKKGLLAPNYWSVVKLATKS